MKELNYSASSPVELPTDAASEQARVVTVRRKLNAAMQMRPRREYRSNKKSTQQLFLDTTRGSREMNFAFCHESVRLPQKHRSTKRIWKASSDIDAPVHFLLVRLIFATEARVARAVSPLKLFCVSVLLWQAHRSTPRASLR
jgi:hypothetical protein